jgi:hypothetical protein
MHKSWSSSGADRDVCPSSRSSAPSAEKAYVCLSWAFLSYSNACGPGGRIADWARRMVAGLWGPTYHWRADLPCRCEAIPRVHVSRSQRCQFLRFRGNIWRWLAFWYGSCSARSLGIQAAAAVSGFYSAIFIRILYGYLLSFIPSSTNVDVQFRLREEIVVGFVMEKLDGLKVEDFSMLNHHRRNAEILLVRIIAFLTPSHLLT